MVTVIPDSVVTVTYAADSCLTSLLAVEGLAVKEARMHILGWSDGWCEEGDVIHWRSYGWVWMRHQVYAGRWEVVQLWMRASNRSMKECLHEGKGLAQGIMT